MNTTYLMLGIANTRIHFRQDELQAAFRAGNSARAAECDGLIAEYALRDVRKPIGVAGWRTALVEKLPDDLKGSLPTVEEIEAELAPRRKKR